MLLRVDADATGSVVRAEVLKGVHPDIDRAAREAVLGWEYKPFPRDGRPVPVSLSVSISFNPDAPTFRSEKTGPGADETGSNAEPSKAQTRDRRLAEILEKPPPTAMRSNKRAFILSGKEHVVELVDARNPVFWEATHSTRTELLYDYQLVKDKDGIVEKRTLLLENGIRNEENNAPLKTNRFYSIGPFYGPVGFLSREWHDLYEYKVIKEETFEGRKAYVVEARPKTGIVGKPNYGKIWVDQADFSVLRIDVEQESLSGFDIIRKLASRRNYKPAFVISHVYGVEKDGLRFPSRTVFTERYRNSMVLGNNLPKELTLSSTTIVYRDYIALPAAAASSDKSPLCTTGGLVVRKRTVRAFHFTDAAASDAIRRFVLKKNGRDMS
ncbi:MAG: energy transducer TonB [Desulfobacterales bacterium]|nr:energy transducer TonB [Desulfobacterales bacterium]